MGEVRGLQRVGWVVAWVWVWVRVRSGWRDMVYSVFQILWISNFQFHGKTQ